MASQVSPNFRASFDASQGAGPSENTTSLTASAQGSTEQKPAKQPSPNESQIPQDLIERESARQPSLPASPISVETPSILSSGNADTFPISNSDDVQNVNGESQNAQGLQKTARQPSLPVSGRAASIQSAGNKDVSATIDSYNALGASKEESQIPRNLLNRKTPSQSSLLFSPRRLAASPLDSSGGANFSDSKDIRSIPADTIEEFQQPQELPKSSTASQYSLPLSPGSETEGVEWWNNSNSRVDKEIPGSWPATGEASPTAQGRRASEKPRHPFLPLSHISSEIDGVKAPSHADTPVAAELPNISNSSNLSMYSSSSSSSLSKSSDRETVRALEPGTEGGTNDTTSVPASLSEERTPPNDLESRVLASPSGSST